MEAKNQDKKFLARKRALAIYEFDAQILDVHPYELTENQTKRANAKHKDIKRLVNALKGTALEARARKVEKAFGSALLKALPDDEDDSEEDKESEE